MYNDNDGCGGCLTILIIFAVFSWISEYFGVILLALLGALVAGAISYAVRSHRAKAPEREAAARAKAAREAEEKLAREEASYWAYVHSYEDDAVLSGKLYTANVIIDKLREETDESKRIKILAFFDRYLPVMTEIIEASQHGDTDIDDAVDRFTETVKAFSKSLYKADDVVDVNTTVLENMAIRDGFYDPYAEDLSLDVDIAPDTRSVSESGSDDSEVGFVVEAPAPAAASPAESAQEEPVPAAVTPAGSPLEELVAVAAPSEGSPQGHQAQITFPPIEEEYSDEVRERLDEAILLDDVDTIRELLDSGEISELDIDDDVLERVEEEEYV